MTQRSIKDSQVTRDQEIANPSLNIPHVLLLGAGASYAAMPNGDKYGKPVPLLRDVAKTLRLKNDFPEDLRELSVSNFESAYSKLYVRGDAKVEIVNSKVHEYFSTLELPETPNLYDVLNLSLRKKDVIATFNWDPFLLQSRIRLAKLGVTESFPRLIFLHGNVRAGYCDVDKTAGLVGGHCSKCGRLFQLSKLLYPVENKNYQDDAFIKAQWRELQFYLQKCFMFTIFGYSAPTTDKEAVGLLKAGWGDVNNREMEQTEVISKVGSDHETLAETWSPFMHTHHYDIIDSFYDSFIANHPRRSIEAYWNQNWEAKFIDNNPIPPSFGSFEEVMTWFAPLIKAENDWKR